MVRHVHEQPGGGAVRLDLAGLAEAAGSQGPNGLLATACPGMAVQRSGLSFWGAGARSWDGKVHRHPEPELFICVSGSGWFEVDGARLPMEPGAAYLVGPDVEHHQIGGPRGMGTGWWLLEPAGDA